MGSRATCPSSTEEVLAGQMRPDRFPVRWEDLPAQRAVHEVKEGTFSIGAMTVRAQLLNHTEPCLGYRLEADGVSASTPLIMNRSGGRGRKGGLPSACTMRATAVMPSGGPGPTC